MKDALNKLLTNKFIEPLILLIVLLISYEYLISPGLKSTDIIINIITILYTIFLVFFSYFYVPTFSIFNKDEDHIEPGETELDYLPKEEIVKKKRTIKKNPTQHVLHPKVLGEYQVKVNKNPVIKNDRNKRSDGKEKKIN